MIHGCRPDAKIRSGQARRRVEASARAVELKQRRLHAPIRISATAQREVGLDVSCDRWHAAVRCSWRRSARRHPTLVLRSGEKAVKIMTHSKETYVIRSPDTDERDVTSRGDERSPNAGVPESDIDQILADSFPASDAPPWTLGVEPARPRNTDEPERRRG